MDWTNRCVFPKEYEPSQRPRLLLTGSCGLLGQAILRLSLQSPPSDPKWSLIAHGRSHPRGLAKQYPYIACEITETQKLGELIKALAPSYVVHAAAMTEVDACEKQQKKAYNHNVSALRALLSSLPPDTFVLHLSTDFVFDGTQSPYQEEDPMSPCNYYGITKQLSEQLLAEASQPWAIIRTSLVYGTGVALSRPPLLSWAKEALAKGKKLPIVNDQWRMPTFVDDLAVACLRVLRDRREGIFHISGEEPLTPYAMLRQAAHYWGYDPDLIEAVDTATLAQVAARPPRTLFSLQKAKEVLNYQSHSLLEALQLGI